jgi:hypothetical protein
MRRSWLHLAAAMAVLAFLLPAEVRAQQEYFAQPHPPTQGVKAGGSPNIQVLSHIPLGGFFKSADVEVEQEPDRPYAYVSHREDRCCFSIVDIGDPTDARVIYHHGIENIELHLGHGGMDGRYFKTRDGRYYYAQSVQFSPGGPNADLGAIVVDVTSLPDVDGVEEVGRIREPDYPGGFHNIFAYKHSDGRVLLFTTVVGGPFANVYDMELFLAGDEDQGLIARVPVPESPYGPTGYHDMYVGYHPESGRDLFWGAGAGGGHVYDMSDPENPRLAFSITGVSGVTRAHTMTPTHDNHYVVMETEYQYAPLRIFDVRAALRGETQIVNRPVGAWTADWRALVHNHHVRYPYVFVSGYEDGLQVFNIQDPTNPVTVGWYYTYTGPHGVGWGHETRGTSVFNGAFGINIRNVDGLIVITDMTTGFWLFRMEGFPHWNGEDWGTYNISNAQDWDRGPAYWAQRTPRWGDVADR